MYSARRASPPPPHQCMGDDEKSEAVMAKLNVAENETVVNPRPVR